MSASRRVRFLSSGSRQAGRALKVPQLDEPLKPSIQLLTGLGVR